MTRPQAFESNETTERLLEVDLFSAAGAGAGITAVALSIKKKLVLCYVVKSGEWRRGVEKANCWHLQVEEPEHPHSPFILTV